MSHHLPVNTLLAVASRYLEKWEIAWIWATIDVRNPSIFPSLHRYSIALAVGYLPHKPNLTMQNDYNTGPLGALHCRGYTLQYGREQRTLHLRTKKSVRLHSEIKGMANRMWTCARARTKGRHSCVSASLPLIPHSDTCYWWGMEGTSWS